ncbi:MAG TPA: GGDEF domain-containing protein [Pirellulaceae bacterium]|nr:GGDEF domain-containing protein [Pirellulaceae bacterium]
MDFNIVGLPFTVALAIVAVLGYFVGRIQRSKNQEPEDESTRRELKRAKAIIHDLETIAQNIRRDLAQHHTNLEQFKTRIGKLSRNQESTNWQVLCDEAERLLKPTQDLARQLAQAYDGIRQQGSRLMTFTAQRCDPLTGLCNRQALDESLENYLSMYSRYGLTFSLAVFDLDGFQQFNADRGHREGDRILGQIAQLLEQNARETDIVARSGGEEFIVLLPSSDLTAASLFAERIRHTIDELSDVTVSSGVAVVAADDDAKTLLTRADTALYAAKAAGRNRVFSHTGQTVLPCQTEAADTMTEAEAAVT